MTKLEFEEILKVLKKNYGGEITADSSNGNSEFLWNGVKMLFYDKYASISGKIPLEVFNKVHNYSGKEPKHWKTCFLGQSATDDIFKDDLARLTREKYWLDEDTIFEEANRNLQNRPDDGKYFLDCRFDSVEDYIIFLHELANYYARKNGEVEKSSEEISKFVSEATNGALKAIEPTIDFVSWTEKTGGDSVERRLMLETVLHERSSAGTFKSELRKKLDEFDRTVNPYINEEIMVDECSRYLRKVDIKCSYIEPTQYAAHQGVKFEIMPKGTLSRDGGVSYQRCDDSINYTLMYSKDGETTFVRHKYGPVIELLTIMAFGQNGKVNDVAYDVTNNAIVNYSESGEILSSVPVSAEQLSQIYSDLETAIGEASSVTISNMAISSNQLS